MAEAVKRGFARCLATLQALRSDAPVDDLPSVAAAAMSKLDAVTSSLGKLHAQAVDFAQHLHAERHEKKAFMEFLEALAAMPTPDQRAEAARTLLGRLKPTGA